uniref:oocyte zinc finger protein XlCOF6.1-like n=1 Tax=Semicossyphus pulcher TaxID=241346 RepID=UPI0037E9A053
MFQTDQLRALVNERLTAAAEEIFSIFEKTLKDYEEAILRSKQEGDPQRSLDGLTAPLQQSVLEDEAASEHDHCEKTDLCETDPEPQQIKEEQEDEPWANQTGETQEEADTKDSLFNIIYVQRSDEDGRPLTHQNQDGQNEGNSLSGQLKPEPDRESYDASEPNSDRQTSGGSDDEWRDCAGFHLSRKPQLAAGETSERPYTCSVCNKTFRIKSILTRHMKMHSGEKPYSCSVCGKSFIQRSYLQTHMNSHTGQKPYTCRFCGRGFTQVGNMNAHIRIHTGEKPHSCSDCGKSFREKADLIRHRIIHTGEKSYICSVCNMKFTTQSNLTRHMKTHSGDRPFGCTACGKSFIRRSHLIIHMKTHAAENL